MTQKKKRNFIGLQIDAADLAVIDKARKQTGHNRSAFFRHASLKQAKQILSRLPASN